ncbi:MAG: hypothetical protein NC081_01410 [Roseburia sp.]|nr:hypothetical protein [Roseburia sp.]
MKPTQPSKPWILSLNDPFRRFFSGLYSFAFCFAVSICLLLAAGLFISAFLCTSYSEDMETQKALTRWDNPFVNLLGLFLFLILFGLITRQICKKPKKYKKLLLLSVLGISGLSGFALILFGRTMPAADAMSVFSIAESFALGDTSAIHPTESYLSYYPQQIGLVAFYEPVIRIWKLFFQDLAAYHFIKCIYVGLMWLIILFQYRTVQLLWHSDRADCLYLLLAGTNLPLIFYSSFVYSEIPSFAALTMGLYFLLKLFQGLKTAALPRRKSLCQAFVSLFCLTLAVLLRKNSLILIIAVVLVTVLEWFRLLATQKKPDFVKSVLLPAFALLCILCSVGILPLVQRLYELRAHNTLSSGVTATSYFAMGMQEASRGNGWYNGFNFYTYQDTGMDTRRTNEIARQAIQERINYFKEHPGYAARFYLYKYLSQWTDGTYACRQATLAQAGGRSVFITSVYQGRGSQYVIGWCNAYQNVLYLGVLLFLLKKLREMRTYRRSLDAGRPVMRLYCLIGLIGVLGGFFFHMLWEANSRYIFLYGLLLMPYGAAGLSLLSERIQKEKHHDSSAQA